MDKYTSFMNTSAIDRHRLVEHVRSDQEALGPTALARFDTWAQRMGGEILEFPTVRALETAFVDSENAELDDLVKTLLRSLMGRSQGSTSAVEAFSAFRSISRDQARRTMNKVPGLSSLFRGLDLILWAIFCCAAFMLVSEGCCELTSKLLRP